MWGPLIWTNLNSLHPSMLCAKFGWNWLSGSEGEDFLKISSMYFCYFVIFFPWKRAGPSIWKHLNPLHLRMLYAKFGWNWLSGSEEEDFFLNFVNVFLLFRNYLSLKKNGGPSFEQTLIPLTQGCFIPSLVEIGEVVQEKKIFQFRLCIFCYFVIISPWKLVEPFICINMSPLQSMMLCAKFGWNWLSASEEEDFFLNS